MPHTYDPIDPDNDTDDDPVVSIILCLLQCKIFPFDTQKSFCASKNRSFKTRKSGQIFSLKIKNNLNIQIIVYWFKNLVHEINWSYLQWKILQQILDLPIIANNKNLLLNMIILTEFPDHSSIVGSQTLWRIWKPGTSK